MSLIDFYIEEKDGSFGGAKYHAMTVRYLSGIDYHFHTLVCISDSLQEVTDKLRSHLKSTHDREVQDSDIRIRFLDNPHAMICDDPKIYVH